MAARWDRLTDDVVQDGNEQVARVRSENGHPLQWIRLHQASEGVAVLAVPVELPELVAHECERFVEQAREARHGCGCDRNRHVWAPPLAGEGASPVAGRANGQLGRTDCSVAEW